VPSDGRRIPGIEGLRALAASSILVFHCWFFSTPNEMIRLGPLTSFVPDLAFGVTLFFVLSGFLLYRPFAAAVLAGTRAPSIRRYLINRMLRILPAYWVILLLVGFVLQSAFVFLPHHPIHGGLFDPSELFSNMFLVQNYRPWTLLTGIVPAWSLGVEVVFYLTLPVLALVALSLARRSSNPLRRRLAALAPALILLAIGASGKAVATFVVTSHGPFAGYQHDWNSVIEKSFWCHADLFAFGSALAVIQLEVDRGEIRPSRFWRAIAAATAVGAYAVTARWTNDIGERLGRSPFNTLMAFACALLVALVVIRSDDEQRQPLLVRFLETRPLVAVGVASYSVFLWHEPIIYWLHDHHLAWSGSAGFAPNLAVTALVTGALSALTWRYVERPALGLKRKKSGVSPPTMPIEQLEAAP
jgi:peptidoglycan/LPS O-acetylase OafA/YrhL